MQIMKLGLWCGLLRRCTIFSRRWDDEDRGRWVRDGIGYGMYRQWYGAWRRSAPIDVGRKGEVCARAVQCFAKGTQ